MREQAESHDHLIRRMRGARRYGLPAGFTEGVMERLPEHRFLLRRAALPRVLRALRYAGGAGTLSRSRLDSRECSFCFLVTGLFFLVLGAVLLAGLHRIGAAPLSDQWLYLLPWSSLAAAAWLMALALALALRGERAAVGAKAGTALFVLAFLVALLFFAHSLGPPVMYIPVTVASTAACMGMLLYYGLSRIEGHEDEGSASGHTGELTA